MAGPSIQLDLRAVLPVALLGVIVLTIILVELCGREDIELIMGSPTAGPTAPVGPTFTPGPSPTPDPAQPTATQEAQVGGDQRDQQRQLDLADIAAAVEAYRADQNEYPSTSDNIQTLCVFTDTDTGCALLDYLDPLPEDPLGDPAVNGYFYQSNGDVYIIYARRESELFPACDTHPAHLGDFETILCLRGPSGVAP